MTLLQAHTEAKGPAGRVVPPGTVSRAGDSTVALPAASETVTVHLSGHFTVTCPAFGIEITKPRHGIIDVMARQLIEAGANPAAGLVVMRGTTRCFNVAPISHWASIRLLEHDVRGFSMGPHRPFGGDA